MTAATHRRLAYRPELDGIRAIAIVLVLAAHTVDLEGRTSAGSAGVQLFFVLSGYLITTIFVADGCDLRRFYKRRIRRLVPALVLFLAVYAAAYAILGDPIGGLTRAMLGASYASNWVRASGQGIEGLNHMWSLAVEEQFYLLWPLLLIVLARRGLVLAGAAVLTVGFVVVRWAMAAGGEPWYSVYYATQSNLPMLLAGSALAAWVASGHGVPRLGWVGLALVLVSIVVPHQPEVPPLAVEAAFLATIVGGVLVVADPPKQLGRLAPLGLISYGLYLWHYPLTVTTGWGLAGVLPALVLAYVSWRWWESRFRSTRLGLSSRPLPAAA